MTKQEAALDHLITRCRAVDPDCGIQLQGSLARGQVRPSSDIDLTIVAYDVQPQRQNELINSTNQGSMIRVHVPERDVDVDINWILGSRLLEIIETRGAADWYMFLTGRTLHDPRGLAAECMEAIARWFASRPSLRQAWEAQQEAVERHKADPTHELRWPTQPAFCAHLRTLDEG